MEKALVRPDFTRIFEVQPAGSEFPVAPPLEWRDCADDVRPETHEFDGTTFVAKPSPPILTADELAALRVDGLDRLQFDVLFNHENRLRALELKPTITKLQYRQALIDRWKLLNP